METNEFIPPTNTLIKPPVYVPSQKPVYLVIGLLAGTLILIIILGLLFFKGQQINNPPPENLAVQISPTKTIENGNFPSLQPTKTTDLKQTIFYLKEGNIWSVQSDGTHLRQITRNGSTDGSASSVTYTNVTQKSINEISYIMCSNLSAQCTISTRNLLTNEEKIELTTDGRLQSIEWSASGEDLTYIKNHPENGTRLYIHNNQNDKELFKFTDSLGRGGGLDDEISLSYSPDGNYLLVVNTSTIPNLQQDNTTIRVFTKEGTLVDSVSKDYATDASWILNDTYTYRSKLDIFKRKINSEEELVYSGEILDILPSVDGKYLVAWNLVYENEKGRTGTVIVSLDTKSIIYQKVELAYARWLNNNEIIALKTQSDQSFLGFSTIGLVKVNTQTNQITTLDSSPGLSSLTVITSQN